MHGTRNIMLACVLYLNRIGLSVYCSTSYVCLSKYPMKFSFSNSVVGKQRSHDHPDVGTNPDGLQNFLIG
jgi:hypothetical protein